jgi:hydrogenase maturation protease
MKKNKILVLGLGNYLMGDEGVGCHVIEYLEGLDYSNQVDLLDGGTGGFHLMDHLVTHEHVILIDATLDDFPEGTIRVIKPKVSKDFPPNMSTHDIGLKDLITSLTLVEQLPDLYLVAVSVKDYDEMRITLSDKIKQTIPEIKNKIDAIVEHFSEYPVIVH